VVNTLSQSQAVNYRMLAGRSLQGILNTTDLRYRPCSVFMLVPQAEAPNPVIRPGSVLLACRLHQRHYLRQQMAVGSEYLFRIHARHTAEIGNRSAGFHDYQRSGCHVVQI